MALVMFVWLWFVSPPEPSPSNQQEAGQDTTEVAQQPAPPPVEEEEPPPEPESETIPVANDSTLAGAQKGEERIITVETDLYEARFSSKGATLVSYELKKYNQFDQQTPVQLVDSSGPGAIALAFTTPASHNVDTRSLYFEPDVQGDTFRVAEEPASLSFVTEVGDGSLRMTYEIKPDEYELDLRVEQENAASYRTQQGYELVWNGGIPFTEDSPEKEARSTGAYARSGGEIVSVTLSEDETQEKTLRGDVSWTAVKSKYFTAVVMPQAETQGATLVGSRKGVMSAPDQWENYTTRLLMPSSQKVDEFRLYLGPMEFYNITDYDAGLYGMVDYGYAIFEWMTRPLAKYVFIPTFELLSSFIPNYGIVIILLAILIKLLVYPLTKRSYKSMAKMRDLQPRMEEIKEKHADNPQKQQEAMMKMYKETGVNPIGGCLPMLLQYPIIIALWQFLPNSIEIRQQGFLWAHDLSSPDIILDLPFTIPFYGNYVAGFTLLMGLSMVVQMRVQSAGSSNAQAKIFQYVLPLILFAVFNGLAAGLSLYYLTYNVITALQQKVINKSIEEEKEENGASRNGRGSKEASQSAEKSSKTLLERFMS